MFSALGFRRVPPTVGRKFNVTAELLPYADEHLAEHFYWSPGKLPTMDSSVSTARVLFLQSPNLVGELFEVSTISGLLLYLNLPLYHCHLSQTCFKHVKR